jgi:flagellar hook assembly protein FlgD
MTRIRYRLPAPARVVLEVFDVHGRKVTTLLDGKEPAGEATVVWDGKDAGGAGVASGVYFCRMRTTDQTITRKMILLR